MSMYLVCYETPLATLKNEKGIIRLFALALRGPFVHCEIVFVQDLLCEALVLKVHNENGFPTFEYKDYTRTQQKFNIHWYKFQTTSPEMERACKLRCKQIVRDKHYQMSVSSLIGTALPQEFSVFFDYIYRTAFEKHGVPPIEGKRQICCSELCALLLVETFAWDDLPIRATVTDLVIHLKKSGRIKSVPHPFMETKVWRIRDKANIQRACIELDDGYIT